MAFVGSLSYIINHVFLPPKLPQKDDSHFENDITLGEQCKAALGLFQAHLSAKQRWKWSVCTKMVDKMLALRDSCGDMMLEEVGNSFIEMDIGEVLTFHIRGQNAGLIVRKLPEHFTFESFELSPTTNSVMTTKGRLRRCFPGPAIALAHDRIRESSFREALAQTLTSLDTNTPVEAWPVVSKAESKTIEVRDTVHPKFVTEMLTGMLRAIGRPFEVNRIHKRTRDDVLWNETLKPWRRSPFWLLLRIALQTNLAPDEGDHEDYKSFMIFFMAHILHLALQRSTSSDILFIMAAKISRRILKLTPGDQQPWMQDVSRVVEATHRELTERWCLVEQNPDPLGICQAWDAARLSFHPDTELSLSNLRPYLDCIQTRLDVPSNTSEYNVICTPRIDWDEQRHPQFDRLLVGSDDQARLSLLDLDLWVQKSLEEWLSINLTAQTTGVVLKGLIENYVKAATTVYEENPEETSLMLLTTMELWISLDKCAIYQYPLLKNYEPGFPHSLFDPLLLPKRVQMERLIRIEKYVQERRDKSCYPSSLIFQDTNNPKSLAIQYFEQSPHHQRLKDDIEVAATNERVKKKVELEVNTKEHRSLLQRFNSLNHDEGTRWNGYRLVPHHYPSNCQKCQLKRQSDALEITVHEWPLPYVEIEAKSAVFELDVPKTISVWRDITFTLLEDCFSPQTASSSSSCNVYTLRNFSGLSDYVHCETSRLQLASVAKPYVVAHYRSMKIPQANEGNICVNNGLHYSIYDTKSSQWTTELLNRCDLTRICTFQLPSSSHHTLQYALDGTTHTSNEVLAWQADCPRNLNLQEFYAFAMLRSGHRLQWRNIACEVTARILNFSHEATHMLIVQAAWQAGCPGAAGYSRDSHIDLEEEEFGMSLLSALEVALQSVEGNWQGAVALRTFVVLATRLLSLSVHQTIHKNCYLFLRRARYVSLQWAREIGELFHEGQDVEESKVLNLRALEMALICHGTFDVDPIHFSALLESNEDVAAITECCIIIYDRCPATTQHLASFLKKLLRRFERLSHLLEVTLRYKILQDQSGIDIAIQKTWDGYRRGSSWTAVSKLNERWLTSQTSADGGCSPLCVHYNVLDGSLLVNGLPLTRLPRSYELHGTYTRLFGKKVLDVVPSTMLGMLYEMRNDICGQKLHFRMHGSELVIQSRRQQQICEVIPMTAMLGDFPMAFIQDYVHWWDLDTQSIEWRPLKDVWASSADNWQMHRHHDTYILSRATKELLDIRSPTFQAISHLLGPLEHATHIHVFVDCQTKALEIHLPRMKLDFHLKDATSLLESKQFRGMVVDDHQSFGAFTGLVNKLVLRDSGRLSRCVIIPEGDISFEPKGPHVQVTIDTASAAHVKYHSYQIDSRLGRLVDNGSLPSRLFRLYLHATTSHCLVDQLTGRTGTEEALYGLESAATRSFVTLEPKTAELLKKLARLTPQREYYPEHLEVMQQVEWNGLSPLAQHCAFYTQVASILDQATSFQIFQEQPTQLPVVDNPGSQFLLERAAIRDSSFQVCGFGAGTFTAEHDTVYSARDQIINSERELNTYHTAKLVDEWSQNLQICPHLLSEIESWVQPLSGHQLVNNPTFGFDLQWLDLPSNILSKHWCTFYEMLSNTSIRRDKYRIMMLLSTLSYSQYAKQELVQTLLAFATIPELRELRPPRYTQFQLSDGYSPNEQKLTCLTEEQVKVFHNCPESKLPNMHGEKEYIADGRRSRMYESAKDKHVRFFVSYLISQWPTVEIYSPPSTDYSTYILVEKVMEEARACFKSWNCNSQFRTYIQQTQAILDKLFPERQKLQRYSFSPPIDVYIPRQSYLKFSDLTKQPNPCLPHIDRDIFKMWNVPGNRGMANIHKLQGLLDDITARCSSAHERRYTGDLLRSFEALNADSTLEAHLKQATHDVENMYQIICDHLKTGTHSLIRKVNMLPRMSPISLLQQLASDKVTALPDGWKESLVQYGLSITALQRAERLLAAAVKPTDLLSELENPGHQDWNPMHHPEWLLMEIENEIMIRQEQAQISREMMVPSSGSNSVMQLNMGLGKSSVIVPIIAAALADKTKLVRVVVLKPLAMQMFQSLVKKLGGMVNRRVVYMPISRSLNLDVHQAEQIQHMYEECKQTGSIVLVQPEHILSFELMGLERVSTNPKLGGVMLETQHWLQTNSRDILDESDEILSVRFELIYTMGMQRAIEFSPERWLIIQHVLGVLNRIAPQVHEQFPHGLEVIPAQAGGFSRIRILQAQAGVELLKSVSQQLCEKGLPGVNMWNLSSRARGDLFRFITDSTMGAASAQLLLNFVSSSNSMKDGLLLLRGLFAYGTLSFAFEQKRWRVNYGLDPSRTKLAVPYHAKDNPAPHAEFSHPDVTIVLTCLSYYYGGLSDQQLRESFEALLLSDHAQEEYEQWVRDAPCLSSLYKHLTGVNLMNSELCSREVFPPLRFAKSVVDFYMSAIVFPAEMKEFPQKLSSSGWDIAQEKAHPTTGFSGTNDSRYVLPLSISQCDLPEQLSTNAVVLGCLLRPENTFIDVAEYSTIGFLNAEVLLKMVSKLDPPVRVVLDVGAQVLELSNEEFAGAWLSRVPEAEAQAVIFFDACNEVYVLNRDRRKEPFQISPFAKQVDQCLVYLDESHTRGTDLKLPDNYRAIVTLGPGLTKDRLVQACMRMRKLGKGQSVVLCSSMEVQRKILEYSGKNMGSINVVDVLAWCIAESCANTRKSIPLWATQGLRHQNRQAKCSESAMTPELVESLLEPEAQSLQRRYGYEVTQHEDQMLRNSTHQNSTTREQQVNDIRAKCQEFEIHSLSGATLQEEQERELSPENEREQQVELPPKLTPRCHSIHKDVRRLIADGVLDRFSDAFQPAFKTLGNTTAHAHYEATAWPDDLLVTADFAKTVYASDEQFLDSFLRPVHWIVSCKSNSGIECVILSPHEAQELLPLIRKHKQVILHVYSPRLRVSMWALENLSFCAIPAVPALWSTLAIITQLNLFAGQLYIRNNEDYMLLCGFLGLCNSQPADHIEIACDGFIGPASRALLDSISLQACLFQKSPIPFVRAIMTMRRKGQSIAVSHIGRILNGELITIEQA